MAGQQAVPSFHEWLKWAEEVAYGMLELLPAQFYTLSPMELDRMAECRFKSEPGKRWEKAYWIACLMSVHTKKPVRTEKLMRPFIPKKTAAQMTAERDAFFEEFKQKGAEEHGDNR